ncbi:MAG: scyllo-inositol 2-dehydrogenase (NAD(+)) [Verrucomicrobia subdivision 3 bacterium]|nr:scyllo-inositol 2-dehydrogenase (NAD(+)) [Limisphaerales bacterium]MCS1413208.1 scyllo-inositol 2-dehydrogenase (NAD(+)) [Limisphaerales bacterium]
MKQQNRRTFLKSTALTTGALALPTFSITRSGLAAHHKVNVAVVGAGGMGRYAVKVGATENLVALCDVDDVRAAQAFKENPKVRRFKDFRVMLDKMWKEINAVAISTPDHTHFAAAMDAMERGKHVFVQKPLAHNIWQLRTLRKAAKHYNVITQMGNQGHTFDGMRRIKEWVGAGVIGDVREVITWTNRPNAPWFVPPASFPPATSKPPKTLDWDLWQGPVAEREYSAEYVPTKWRGWWDYGCGALGDIGCHTFDAPFAVLDLGSPTKVEVVRQRPPGEGFIPMGAVVTYHFPARGQKPPVTLKWYEAGFDVPKPRRWDPADELPSDGGMYMEGTKETLYHEGMRPTEPVLTPSARFAERKAELDRIERLPEVGGGPIEEWLQAIKGDGPMPLSNFDYAVPLTQMVLLGAIVERTGRTIEWDPENMRIKGQPDLDPLINEPVRDGWQYGVTL